jgi:hypothetical protein
VCLLPVGLVQIARGKHDVVATILRKGLNAASIILIDELAEVLVDDMLLDGKFVLREVGHLLQHARSEVGTVKELEVDVKMRWDVPLFLLHLLLSGLFSLSRVTTDALRKTLLQLRALCDLVQELVALVEVTETEGGQATLNKGAVVEYLVANLLLGDQ